MISIYAAVSNVQAQAGPPGGPGGGDKVQLSDLGCGPGEVARVNAADEWECSVELTAAELAIINAQSTGDIAVINAATAQSTADTALSNAATAQSTADTAVADAAAAQSTANSALSAANTAQGSADTALTNTAAAQSTADTALSEAGAAQSTADSAASASAAAQSTADLARSEAGEAIHRADAANFEARRAQSVANQALTETANLDSRVTALEATTLQAARTILVSPVGETPSDNGLILLDAVQLADSLVPAPSATNPAVVLLEPGLYDLGDQLAVFRFVSLVGFDRQRTVVISNRNMGVINASVKSVTIIAGTSNIGMSGSSFEVNDVIIEGRWAVRSTSGNSYIRDSIFTVDFKCIDLGTSGLMVVDGLECNANSLAEINYGLELVIENSVSTGGILIFDSRGPDTNFSIRNSEIGWLRASPTHTPPTQQIAIDIRHSSVSQLTVNNANISANVLFSDVAELNQSGGEAFVSTSIVDLLNVIGGETTVVNSQISSRTLTGGIVSCPFSYDGNFLPLSPSGGPGCP